MKSYRLLDPPGWDKIPPWELIDLKCGYGLNEKLVPDVWWFGYPIYKPLVISQACERHDAEYRWLAPPSEAGRSMADLRFRKNLQRLTVNAGGPRWLISHRMDRSYEYWWFVRRFGYQAFWGERVKAIRSP